MTTVTDATTLSYEMTRIMALEGAVDAGWTILAGVLVFFMQAGFTLLEAGCVRTKNTMNIVMKNLIDICVGAIGWWATGWGLAFGSTEESLGDGYAGNLMKPEGGAGPLLMHRDMRSQMGGASQYPGWFFQFTFCATAATIVSGALAERARIEGYVLFTIFMTCLIYPIVVHWTWGGGWLTEEGYGDFAGSGIVHMTGGVAALWGALIVGPRVGRFDLDTPAGKYNPSNLLNVCFGTFILWFGWFGFNAGSTVALSGGNSDIAGQCAVTTTLAAACGGFTCFIASSIKVKKYDLGAFANGILGGLVSITAGCATVDTAAAVFIGLVGGLVVFGTVTLFDVLGYKTPVKIDDPISAFAVHGAAGAWGVIAVGIFDMYSGVYYGSGFDVLLQPNLIGVVAITAWVSATTAPFFLVLKVAGILRVSADMEKRGLDSEMVPHRLASKDAGNSEEPVKNEDAPMETPAAEEPAKPEEAPASAV